MSEFTNRVEAQRRLLKIVNAKKKHGEELFSLSDSAIQRWSSVNGVDPSSRVVDLLKKASDRVFVMANHSDAPIADEYLLTVEELCHIGDELKEVVESEG
ncbi:MAG TPA: hypothetical protein VK578_01295 [Edaphobacter sp.]|nr:hypothetical protein [Edaphobacter sp.]